MNNWFTELGQVDVSEYIEKKNNLSYVSWMAAWAELKRRYPLSYATVYENTDGSLIWPDPIGCHVKTSVTLVWKDEDGQHEHTATEYLPVMDYKNKSIPKDNVTSMDVNKTIQRSLTKCIARLGLGWRIYIGEDTPDIPEEVKQAKAEAAAKEAEELVSLKTAIEKESKRITKSMTQEEKVTFANDVIGKTIGQLNYKTCNNVQGLRVLLSRMKDIKEAA